MPAIWKGSISFGLVSIPVELATAVRADHISFRLLDAKTHAPVKYERVRSTDGKSLAWDDIVKGYEYSKGHFIVLTDEDFKSAALESSSTIDILDFVAATEMDPRYFETPYFLVPGKGGAKPYALLREAMREQDAVGIGKIIMRQHQHLVGIHVVDDALVLEIMRFANEVLDASSYTFPPKSAVDAKQREMATQLVNSLSTKFEPEKYTDDYRANLMRIIKAKSKGKDVKLEMQEPDEPDAKVLDLMEMLKKSLANGKSSTRKTAAKGAARNTVRQATTKRAREKSA